jgi:hypothetical protein
MRTYGTRIIHLEKEQPAACESIQLPIKNMRCQGLNDRENFERGGGRGPANGNHGVASVISTAKTESGDGWPRWDGEIATSFQIDWKLTFRGGSSRVARRCLHWEAAERPCWTRMTRTGSSEHTVSAWLRKSRLPTEPWQRRASSGNRQRHAVHLQVGNGED